MNRKNSAAREAEKQMMKENTDLNLMGEKCPMAFVKARLFLEALGKGEARTILFEETKGNAPFIRSIIDLGYTVDILEKNAGTCLIKVMVP